MSFNYMEKLINQVKAQEKEVVIYGAGEVGRNLIQSFLQLDINILGVTDSNKELWGKSIEGFEIEEFKNILESIEGQVAVVIASRKFVNEIESIIHSTAISANKFVRVYRYMYDAKDKKEDIDSIREEEARRALIYGKMEVVLSNIYLHGTGVKIRALNQPLCVENAKAKYTDKMDEIMNIDCIDNEALLTKVQDEALDFILANDFLQYCENPIGAIRNFLRKIKKDGILFLTVPVKNKDDWDKNRELTSFDHLVKDDMDEGASSRYIHYKEWVTLVEERENEITKRTQELMDLNYNIHFHVWDRWSLIDFVKRINVYLGIPFRVESYQYDQEQEEIILILKKTSNK